MSALLLSVVPVSAHERGLTIDVDDADKVEIRSRGEIPGLFHPEVDFRFRAESDGPKLTVQAENETEFANGTIEIEIEIELSADFRLVFEFEDDNGNGIQDIDEPILSSMELGDLVYDAITIENVSSTEVAPPGPGIDGFKVSILGSDADGFSFGLVSYIFPDDAQLNATLVPEQAVKVDIAFNRYNFTSDTSMLGLEIWLNSSTTNVTEFGDDSVSTENGTAFFEWASQALIDGEKMTVASQSVTFVTSQSESVILFLFYPHGSSILHDPLLGFAVSEIAVFPSTTLVIVAVVSVAIMLLTLAAILATRIKKARQEEA